MSQLKEMNGKQYMTAKVVMLTTENNKSINCPFIMLNNGEKIIILRENDTFYNNESWTGQHLYITTNEEIKEGNWFYSTSHNKVFKCVNEDDLQHFDGKLYKVIATTDSSLRFSNLKDDRGDFVYNSLPQPSKEFIQAFIESYNNGNVIEDVLVEVEIKNITKFSHNRGDVNIIDNFQLKVSKENTITIKKVKDNYSRDEVVDLFKRLQWDMAQQIIGNRGEDKIIPLEWLENNI